MTTYTPTAVPAGLPPAPAARIEWRRAWRAARALIADPERTEMAFEAIAAVSARDFERLFQRLIADPDGRMLVAERPSLLSMLSDRTALRALPRGTFGRAYADFMDAAQLDAQGLVDADLECESVMDRPAQDPARDWLSNRMRDVHDLWHVLTGYGRDEAGEAANLAFSYAHTGFRGMALILALLAVRRPAADCGRLAWQRYLVRAWRRGRRSGDLVAARYERLLPLPLEDVRRSLRIPPADEVHPEGILVTPPVMPQARRVLS